MKPSLATIVLIAGLVWAPVTGAQEASPPPDDPGVQDVPRPPSGLTAEDHSWDDGTRIDLTWELSPDDPSRVEKYFIYSSESAEGPFTLAAEASRGAGRATAEKLERNQSYFFQIRAIDADGNRSTPVLTTAPTTPTLQWFDGARIPL
jgi:hypothetical protein